MKPVNFDYARPSEIDVAIRLLADESRIVKLMAGNQSLGPMLNLRLVQPDLIVDLTALEELRRVAETAEDLIIGACVTHADIEDLRVPDFTNGALPFVAGGIAYRAIRNRGTIGGSLVHADPSADWQSIMAALGARVTVRGSKGERTLAIEAFMIGALESDLQHDEILVSVSVPKLSKTSRWGYFKSCRKTGEFAHAIGAFVLDRERGYSRAVIGATEGRPVVITDADALFDDRRVDGPGKAFESGSLDKLLVAAGMQDALDRKIHVAALRRAVEQAWLR